MGGWVACVRWLGGVVTGIWKGIGKQTKHLRGVRLGCVRDPLASIVGGVRGVGGGLRNPAVTQDRNEKL